MPFNKALAQVQEKVRSKGRVTYQALKHEFTFEDDFLEDLNIELSQGIQIR